MSLGGREEDLEEREYRRREGGRVKGEERGTAVELGGEKREGEGPWVVVVRREEVTDWCLSWSEMITRIFFLSSLISGPTNFPTLYFTGGVQSYILPFRHSTLRLFTCSLKKVVSICAPRLRLNFLPNSVSHYRVAGAALSRPPSPTPIFARLFAIHGNFFAFVISFHRALTAWRDCWTGGGRS